MEPLTKPKIVAENLMTVIDINKNCLSLVTLAWIAAQQPTYKDTVMKEHQYSIEDLQVDVQDCEDETVREEVEQIAALAHKPGASYVRVIYT